MVYWRFLQECCWENASRQQEAGRSKDGVITKWITELRLHMQSEAGTVNHKERDETSNIFKEHLVSVL